MPADKIGDWDTTTLTKFIRDVFTNQPPQQLPTLEVDQLTVHKQLIVNDLADFASQRRYKYVGQVGNSTFQNGWVNYGGGYDNAGYLIGIDNFIRLHGVIKSGTIGTAAFTLPPGYRPTTAVSLQVISNNATGRLDVNSDGTVVPQTPSSNVWVSLDGVSFKRSIIDEAA